MILAVPIYEGMVLREALHQSRFNRPLFSESMRSPKLFDQVAVDFEDFLESRNLSH